MVSMVSLLCLKLPGIRHYSEEAESSPHLSIVLTLRYGLVVSSYHLRRVFIGREFRCIKHYH